MQETLKWLEVEINKYKYSWAYSRLPWLTPVFPALWKAEVRSSKSAWPTWQNSVSTKNTKLAERGGACL